jgi:hypothetical protein
MIKADTIEDTLTDSLWRKWQQQGTQTKLTWIEIHNLAEHLTKLCKEENLDYQAVDFQAIIDPTLNYYENLSIIAENIKGPIPQPDLLSKYSKEEIETAGAAYGYSNDILEKVQKERSRLQTTCERLTEQIKEQKTIQQERDALFCKCATLEEKYSHIRTEIQTLTANLPTQPVIVPILQTKQEKPIETLNALTAPYTEEEMIEIQEYILNHTIEKPKKTLPLKRKLRSCWEILKDLEWIIFKR